MNVIISEKQEERIKSTIKEIVEDIKVPLAITVDVKISEDGTIYVIIPLKNYLGFNSREKYESLIRDKVKNYLGLNVTVVIVEKSENS
jgi:hypothetical protein